MTVARIVVSGIPYSVDKPYDYLVPDSLTGVVVPGLRVIVPFGKGNRRHEGVVLAVKPEEEREKLKAIEKVLEEAPLITAEQIKLALWMRERFFCTVYDAFRAILPAGVWFRDGVRRVNDKNEKYAVLAVPCEDAAEFAAAKRARSPRQADILSLLSQIEEASVPEILYFTGSSRAAVSALQKQGLITLESREVFRKPEVKLKEPVPIVLNEEQQRAYDGLVGQLAGGNASAALLYGVTGSGKTSVYIKLIEHVLEMGKTAILLVPEIALTPQLMSTFASYFKDDVALLHSSLGMGERYDEWKRIRSGAVHVVIGTRSAVFAPVEKLGVIILDEEQEATYKSESSPRYHAADVAKYRCAHLGALVVFGSATPSVSSMYRAKSGKYKLYTLAKRYNAHAMPGVIPVDMRSEIKGGNCGDISGVLAGEIEENLRRGEQTILFLNRRGANSAVVCSECGYTFSCPRCSVHMTYHSANRRLMCHYCGYSMPEPTDCPSCKGSLKFLGTGTQKVEEELQSLFPETELLRMDADTVTIAQSHEKLFSRFREEKIPIMLGTQMVAKGLDFSSVTLVGVLNADSSLYMNDFRARERTFSMITQVVGRAGRGERTGRAVVQSMTPENEVILLAGRQDYDAFYESEISLRRLIDAPPFSTFYLITCSGCEEAAVLRACTLAKSLLNRLYGKEKCKLLGPAPAPVTRVNNRYHYRITLICEGSKTDRERVGYTLQTIGRDKNCRGVIAYADTEA